MTEDGRNFGTFDNAVIPNTDIPCRKYHGRAARVELPRVGPARRRRAHYTIQLKNEGNFEGEAANQPGNYSIIGDRPEFYTEPRHYPCGRLDALPEPQGAGGSSTSTT